MIKKYIKTTPVEAIQVTEDNHKEVREFAFLQRIVFGYGPIRNSIDTLEGKMRFSDGDYLIKNQTGECYVCQKDIFEKTYKEVEGRMITTQTTLEDVFKIMTDLNVDTINIDFDVDDVIARAKIKLSVLGYEAEWKE